jgi:hypothetical protein
MSDPAQAANDDLNGVFDSGWPRWWCWVDGRRDYVLGYNQNHVGHNAPESIPGYGQPGAFNPNDGKDRGPFTNTNPKGEKHVGTVSHLDHGILAAEATGFRYVASDGHRYDLPDIMILLLESLIQSMGPDGMEKLRAAAAERRTLPWDQS